MDPWKKVENVLAQNPDGINLNDAARKSGLRPSTLCYYIYGEKKGPKTYGGKWAEKLKVKKYGNVTILSLK